MPAPILATHLGSKPNTNGDNKGATGESPLRVSILRRLPLTRDDWIALGVITLTVIAFFAPVLFAGYWLPNGGGDLVSFLWPTYSFASRTLHSGELPLWNPHLYGGAPFWADNQSGVMYPPTLAILLLTTVPYQALEGSVIAHIWLAGLAMYACLRLIDERIVPVAACAGAIVYMLSDGFVTHIGNLNLIAVAAWLPLVFVGTWRGLRDLDIRWSILGGVALGIGTLAGHAPTTLFTAIVLGGVGLFWIIASLVSAHDAGWRSAGNFLLKRSGLLALVGVIGLGLSAGGWLPAIEMTANTARTELTYEAASAYSLPPRALIGVIAPWIYGRGPAAFTGTWDRVEVGYIGVIALALSIVGGVFGTRNRSTRPLAIFLIVLAVTSFLLALGRFFPLHQLVWEIVPGFKSIRAPARFTLLMNFAQAGLAAFAVWQFTQWLKSREFLKWIAPAVVAVELIAFGATAEIDSRDPRVGFNHPEAAAWLSAQLDQPFRIDTVPAASWQPDLAARSGGPLYDSYGIPNPLILATYHTAYWAVGHRGSPTYNMLGIKYVVSDTGPPGDATFVPVANFPDGLTIFLNQNSLPMAWLVSRAISVDSQPAAFERTQRPNWDPRITVIVEGGPRLALDAPPGTLTYQAYEANRITLHAGTLTPAYVVLSETHYPGWVAMLDGQEVPIYRANATLRAVYIESPGSHTIDLVFWPTLVYAGIAISGVTLIALIMWVVLRGKTKPLA